MAIYANLTSAQTSFYLTQVSPAAAGQVLNVRLFDIGDSTQPGTVTIRPPADSNLSSFSGCIGDRTDERSALELFDHRQLELQRQVGTDIDPDTQRLHV